MDRITIEVLARIINLAFILTAFTAICIGGKVPTITPMLYVLGGLQVILIVSLLFAKEG